MGRIRTIKPAFFKHEELYDLEANSGLPIRLAFAGLWTIADKQGRFKWRPRAIKSDVLPFDNVDFEVVLDTLVSGGHLIKYEVDGEVFGCIPSFSDHQRPNSREPDSALPDPAHASTENNAHAQGEREQEGEGNGVNLPTEDTPISDAVEIYRAVATDHDLPQPRLTDRVKANLSKTLKAYGLDEWQAGCGKIRGSPFLRGENDRGWQVTLSWLAEKSKFEKVIEGRYDGTRKPMKQSQSEKDDAAFREAARRIGANQ